MNCSRLPITDDRHFVHCRGILRMHLGSGDTHDSAAGRLRSLAREILKAVPDKLVWTGYGYRQAGQVQAELRAVEPLPPARLVTFRRPLPPRYARATR